jgi:hypothetical protein
MDEKPGKKRPHNTVHNLTARHSSVSKDWDSHLGASISSFCPKYLPTVRAVLCHYRYLRETEPTEKTITFVTLISKEVQTLWQNAWIPHYEDLRLIKSVVSKAIHRWTDTSKRPEKRSKPDFQASLDTLLDIRPVELRDLTALEANMKKTRNEHWQDDLEFFKGQLKVITQYQ